MTSLDLLSRTPIISSLVISLLVCLSVLGLRNLGNLESLELAAYDRFIRFRSALPGPNARIALVGITERDISAQGRWPISEDTRPSFLVIRIPAN